MCCCCPADDETAQGVVWLPQNVPSPLPLVLPLTSKSCFLQAKAVAVVLAHEAEKSLSPGVAQASTPDAHTSSRSPTGVRIFRALLSQLHGRPGAGLPPVRLRPLGSGHATAAPTAGAGRGAALSSARTSPQLGASGDAAPLPAAQPLAQGMPSAARASPSPGLPTASSGGQWPGAQGGPLAQGLPSAIAAVQQSAWGGNGPLGSGAFSSGLLNNNGGLGSGGLGSGGLSAPMAPAALRVPAAAAAQAPTPAPALQSAGIAAAIGAAISLPLSSAGGGGGNGAASSPVSTPFSSGAPAPQPSLGFGGIGGFIGGFLHGGNGNNIPAVATGRPSSSPPPTTSLASTPSGILSDAAAGFLRDAIIHQAKKVRGSRILLLRRCWLLGTWCVCSTTGACMALRQTFPGALLSTTANCGVSLGSRQLLLASTVRGKVLRPMLSDHVLAIHQAKSATGDIPPLACRRLRCPRRRQRPRTLLVPAHLPQRRRRRRRRSPWPTPRWRPIAA